MESKIKMEIHQLLVKAASLLENDEKCELEIKSRINIENDALKLKLVQMSDELQQKDLIICEKNGIIGQNDEKLKHQEDKIIEQDELLQQKDSIIEKNRVFIAQRDELIHHQEVIMCEKVELLKRKDEFIVEQNELLLQKDVIIDRYRTIFEQKEVIIAEQKDFMTELNVIIDESEMLIERKEDVISSMTRQISELEKANNSARRQLNVNRRTRQPGSGETLFDLLKMQYKNAKARFQHQERNFADKIASMEDYISFLHATLDRNRYFDAEARETNYGTYSVFDETIDAQQFVAIENDENRDPNCQLVGLDDEDLHSKSCCHNVKNMGSLAKGPSSKNISKPRKKVKFSNVTAAFFSA